MMNMRCADCRHWIQDAVSIRSGFLTFEGASLGECRRASHQSNDKGDVVVPNGSAAAVTEHEGITGELVTHADFGCVRFEALV